MMRTFFGSLGLFLFSANVVLAQPSSRTAPIADDAATTPKAILGPPIISASKPESNPVAAPNTSLPNPNGYWSKGNCCPDTRFWVSAEYLLWRVSSAPIRVPLVTGNNDPNTIAALNDPGTAVLFGQGSGQSKNFGWFSGGRVTLGGWIDQGKCIGFEASGFLLENRSTVFSAASAGGPSPIVSIPFDATQPFNNNPQGPPNQFNNPAGPTAFSSGNAPNSVVASLTSRLWGAEANGVVNMYSTERVRVTGLIGMRYLDLLENLTLTDTTFDTLTNGALSVTDGFGTRNQFYGGQIGMKAAMTFGRWNVDTGIKVALGSNHEVLNVAGATTVTNGAFGFNTGTTPGGIFAQNTNIGTNDRNVFAVVPEAQVKVGYMITPHLQSFVGYNYLYLSNALRPGNQVDSNTQALFFVPAGTGGAPAPATLRSSSFSAQGVSFGVALKY
jgi:hypothetical protein